MCAPFIPQEIEKRLNIDSHMWKIRSNYSILIYKIETDIYQGFTLACQKFCDINISSPIGFITVPLSDCVISCLQNRDHKQFHWTRSLLNFLLTTQLIHTKDNKLQDTLLQLQEKQETTEQLPSPNKRQQLNKDNAQRTTSDRGDQQPKKKNPPIPYLHKCTDGFTTHS
jgi:hypothetical protein